jgi:hypothetical protein
MIGLVRSWRGVVLKKISSSRMIAVTFSGVDQIISRKGIGDGQKTGTMKDRISKCPRQVSKAEQDQEEAYDQEEDQEHDQE